MNFIDELSVQSIVAIIAAILGCIAMINEKVRGFLLTKLTFSKSKAELKNDAVNANDSSLDVMMKRIDVLSTEFVRLSELNQTTQQENFELKGRLQALEYECEQIKTKINSKCLNKCLDV